MELNHQRKRPRFFQSLLDSQTVQHRGGLDGLFSCSKASFSFRLQHRDSAIDGLQNGEERFLLFRPGRSGPDGKLVFSVRDTGNCSIQVKILSLNVKPHSRGFDLGGLMITEVLRYMKEAFTTSDSLVCGRSECDTVMCQLEAEEDDRRNNKLVRYYERFGFRVKQNAKIKYLNNNDGEMYRKIPMELVLNPTSPKSEESGGSLVGSISFLPVRLFSATESTVRVDEEEAHFLLVDLGNGLFEIRTTRPSASWRFHFLSVQDMGQTKDQTWLLRLEHEYECCTFLGVDMRVNSLSRTSAPVEWTFDGEERKLCCTGNSPSRRFHAQMIESVEQMKKTSLRFSMARMSLFEALELSKRIPDDKVCANGMETSSLYAKCFQTAESFRWAGHPDWMQLLGLTYYLGDIVPLLDVPPSTSLPAMWNGPEYICRVFLKNNILIPNEGYQMLRLAELGLDLPSHRDLLEFEDQGVEHLVMEFANVLSAQESMMENEECATVWDTHYKFIAEKYGMNQLSW